jgi:hypothetical protein
VYFFDHNFRNYWFINCYFTENPQILQELADATMPENKYVGVVVNVKRTGKNPFLKYQKCTIAITLFCQEILTLYQKSQNYKYLVGIGYNDLDFSKN